MAMVAKTGSGRGDGFMPRARATRGQTLVGAFCVLLLAGSFIASATIACACAGLSICQTGAAEPAGTVSLNLPAQV